MSARTPRATPTPMPAFAPALRPVGGWGVAGLLVAVAVGVADEGEVVEVGGVVGVDVDVDADEDAVAVASEVDHVVAERSDLWECCESASILVCGLVSCKLGICYAFGGRS